MSRSVDEAVARLIQQFPLRRRMDELAPAYCELYRVILKSLIMRGCPPGPAEIAELVGAEQAGAAVAALGAADLVVLSEDRHEIVGAYPVTSEQTPHALHVYGHWIHAMCALDAVAVAPMFGTRVDICSRCRITGDEVRITQDGARVLAASPAGVKVGVRWQIPGGPHAAHSMCKEMAFLKDDTAAAAWHLSDFQNHSVFTLDEAAEFGARFFKPLL